MTAMAKILFTTAILSPHREYIDDSCNPECTRFLKFRRTHPSPGLRFIKRNIPQIEILEYPTWEEYCQKLEEGWDVVGFSFYLYQTYEVLRMIREARRRGVKEIWGGNYGVLTPEIQKYFDRIFIGYAEEQIANVLGTGIWRVKHPFLWIDFGTPLLPLKARMGYLSAVRGCQVGCSFCQTPSFCSRVSNIPLSSVREVLEEFDARGIKRIYISDENFGSLGEYCKKVIDMLGEYGFEWFCQTRPDLLGGRVERWREKGLESVGIGIESFSQENLNYVNTRKSLSDILRVIRELRDNGVRTHAYIIIGYPNQVESDIKREAEEFSSLDLDSYRITILTPFPKTPLWNMLSKYGPFDPDYSKYDCSNLVWNHPTIERERMRELLLESYEMVYPWSRQLRSLLNSMKALISKGAPIFIG